MLAVSTAALAQAGTASASDEGYYVSGNGGVTLPPNLTLKSNTLGNMKENLGTGYTYGGSAGYDFGTGWRVQVDSQYTYQSVDRLNGARDERSCLLDEPDARRAEGSHRRHLRHALCRRRHRRSECRR
jgi:hypothetical protein